MKKFARHRSVKELKVLCRQQNLLLNTKMYDNSGDDYVVVSGGGASVFYNTFNGTFFGSTPGGTVYNSSSTKHESKPWFQALLNFFYVGKEGEA